MAEETRQRDESELICSLARGLPHAQAAQAAGVSVRTVQRRASEPAFRAATYEIQAFSCTTCASENDRFFRHPRWNRAPCRQALRVVKPSGHSG